jgi:Protein of unknown function (DUF2798)
LIGQELSDHIAAACRGESRSRTRIRDGYRFADQGTRVNPEARMEGKARFIFPIVITAIIVFIVSGVVTFFNIGLRADFVPRWLSAFLVGWPIAAVTAFVALPFARSLTQRIVGLIEGTT